MKNTRKLSLRTIDPSLHEKIFAPFFSTKGARGTGMGLAIVRGIVQQHGGRIELESAPGAGARFRVLLPIGTPPVVEQTQRPSTSASTLRILVIDDEDAVRTVLVRILQRIGHHVDAFASGEDALAGFNAGQYQLVCTDLGMPGLSGWDVAAQIRRIDPLVRIVLVTGWSEQIDRHEARLRGVDAILSKPFTIQQVRSLLAELLNDVS